MENKNCCCSNSKPSCCSKDCSDCPKECEKKCKTEECNKTTCKDCDCKKDNNDSNKHSEVSSFYSNILTSKETQLRAVVMKDYLKSYKVRKIMGNLSHEVITKNLGCGSPIPNGGYNMKGLTVLDLGSGAGRDTFICAALVGSEGKAIGVDMTQSAIDFSNSQIKYHENKFNDKKEFKNGCGKIEFIKSFIEDIPKIKDNSIDLIISNCVINLSPSKSKVLKEMFRILKEGGEIYFSDIFSDRRVPKELKQNSNLWGQCVSGAMYINDFIKLIQEVGLKDFRIVSSRKKILDTDLLIHNGNKDILNLKEKSKQFSDIGFYSLTVRFFKNKNLSDSQIKEDFQETVTYLGKNKDDNDDEDDIELNDDGFVLDLNNIFIKNKQTKVDSNTAQLLRNSRYSKLFKVSDKKYHIGQFLEKSPYQIMKETKQSQKGCGGGSCCL